MKYRSVFTILFIGLFVFAGWPQAALAQSPYELSAKKDLTIMGLSSGLLTTSVFIGRKKNVMDKERWEKLDRSRVFYFDRPVTYNWSIKAHNISDGLLYSSIVGPLALGISRKSHSDLAAVGLITLETGLLNIGLTNLAKNLVLRPRPFTYNHEMVPWEVVSKQKLRDTRRSFFSGHTSTSASMYFMSAQMYSDFHPNSDFKTAAWISAAAIPALTGWLRVKAGKHYYTDVITGYVVGAVIGILIPRLHR